jgi:hypothetical protein
MAWQRQQIAICGNGTSVAGSPFATFILSYRQSYQDTHVNLDSMGGLGVQMAS